MKKLVLLFTLIVISFMIFNVYSVLRDQESLKAPLFSFQKALADDEGGSNCWDVVVWDNGYFVNECLWYYENRIGCWTGSTLGMCEEEIYIHTHDYCTQEDWKNTQKFGEMWC
jgi:hypothetical protein